MTVNVRQFINVLGTAEEAKVTCTFGKRVSCRLGHKVPVGLGRKIVVRRVPVAA